MISGFLTARTVKKNDKVWSAFVNKVIRILPMAFLSVLCYYTISLSYKCITGNVLLGESFDYKQVMTSFVLINQGWILEHPPAINNPIWYLCVLIWVNILYALIRYFTKDNIKNEVVVSCCLIAIGVIGHSLRQEYGFEAPFLYESDCRGYATFFMGIVLYRIFHKYSDAQRLYASQALLFLSILGMVALGVCNWYVLVLIFFPGVILFVISVPQIDLPGITLCGGVSYEAYLWHMPIYCLIRLILGIAGIAVKHSYFTMFIFCLLVWVISSLLYNYVEIRIREKLTLMTCH